MQSPSMFMGLNELQAVLYPSLAAGCLVGGWLSWFAATRQRTLLRLPLLLQ